MPAPWACSRLPHEGLKAESPGSGESTDGDYHSAVLTTPDGVVLFADQRTLEIGGERIELADTAPEHSYHLNHRVIGIFGLCPKEPTRVPRSRR